MLTGLKVKMAEGDKFRTGIGIGFPVNYLPFIRQLSGSHTNPLRYARRKLCKRLAELRSAGSLKDLIGK